MMSLAMFHKLPAGASETYFDEQNQLMFKRSDLRKCICIADIARNFKNFITITRQEIPGQGRAGQGRAGQSYS